MIEASHELWVLHDAFESMGFNLWFVGGCVRDDLLDLYPKDIDLCTDATPDEQIEVYKLANFRYAPTGLQHGTITVIIGAKTYEVTTLRTDSDHDGRHATVDYTTDLIEDLERRDLTINSMAQDFEGNLFDPFGGAEDLKNGVIRFVGDPNQRIKEDYLRILRYFRFEKRFGVDRHQESYDAIIANAEGLKQISVERIWMEMKQILVGNNSSRTIYAMGETGILDIIGFNWCPYLQVVIGQCYDRGITDPCSVIGFAFESQDVRDLANRWKWSTYEKDRAIWISQNHLAVKSTKDLKWKLVNTANPSWVYDLARMAMNEDLEMLQNWKIPVFPVNGHDMIAAGLSGPDIRRILDRIKVEWSYSNYKATREQLLSVEWVAGLSWPPVMDVDG